MNFQIERPESLCSGEHWIRVWVWRVAMKLIAIAKFDLKTKFRHCCQHFLFRWAASSRLSFIAYESNRGVCVFSESSNCNLSKSFYLLKSTTASSQFNFISLSIVVGAHEDCNKPNATDRIAFFIFDAIACLASFTELICASCNKFFKTLLRWGIGS